jgi:hypothetical protein
MRKLVEIRSQEHMCRERAALDSERRIFWLAQAEKWEQRALEEIAYHFRECNRGRAFNRSPTSGADLAFATLLPRRRLTRRQAR